MRTGKIFRMWVGMMALFLGSLVLPHHEVSVPAFLSYSIQGLLFLVSAHIVVHEPSRNNKFIFLNFTLFFSLSFLFHLKSFVGTLLFTSEPFARFYFYQYVSSAAYFLLLAFAIVYLAIDVVLRPARTWQKYMVTLAIVGGVFFYHYHPVLKNPKHIYESGEVREFRALEKAYVELRASEGASPSPERMMEYLDVRMTDGLDEFSTLERADRLHRIESVYTYFDSDEAKILVVRPLALNTIYMSVLAIGFILLFFGYQYVKDPPQGAYVEKIMLSLLVFCSMEIFHAWSMATSPEWRNMLQLMSIGQYVSLAILMLVALFFFLRLRFITSPKGEFYENEIASAPAAITRWRDALDNVLVSQFMNPQGVFSRMFVDPSRKTP